MTTQLQLNEAQRKRAESFQRRFDAAQASPGSMSLPDLQKLTQEYAEFLKQVQKAQE